MIEKLEIFLITYNRKKHLQNTFNQIFAKNSPIKDLQITILDNKSTDGTSELIQSYCKKFPNIKHIIHNRNIGGNANIARTFELASKKYFWILCDDDFFDWTHWDEVVKGINKNADAILTERIYPTNQLEIPFLINELTFCPAAIYKTENITNDVLQNAYTNIYASFPHMALICSLVNKKGYFYLPDNTVLLQGIEQKTKKEYIRGYSGKVHFRQAHTNLFSGYINSYQMIEDKKLRHQCCDVLCIGKSFFYSMKVFLNSNGFYMYNIFDVWNGINNRQRALFLGAIFLYSFKVLDKKQSLFFSNRKKLYKTKVLILSYIAFKRKRMHYKKRLKEIEEEPFKKK